MHERRHDHVVVGGHRINYSTIGEGAPLMLVPGNSMSSERWIETGYVDALSDGFRLILVDPLGHGESEKVADRAAYQRSELIGHLIGVIDHLGLERVAGWGYSRGAQMLGAAATSEPARFSRVVLGGIPLFDTEAVLRELGLQRDPSEFEDAFAKSAEGDWEAFWSVFPVPIPEESKLFLQERNDPAAITAATAAARFDPYVFALAAVPTLAVWGDGEIFHQLNLDTAATFGAGFEFRTLTGGHAEAYADSAAAVDVVRPFLVD